MEEKNKIKQRNTIIIILIIIIILLLIFCIANFLGRIEVKAPTGDVDIYDIKIIENINKEKQVIVYDENGQEIDAAPLKIFEHKSDYVKNDVIAPGTENTYQFIIRNNNEFAIIYDFAINEINTYNINMKFRIKQNGEYILGDDKEWVTAEQLKQNGIILAHNSFNVYTLEWKWFESENDTQIGKNIESDYKLDITFNSNRY